MAKKAISTETLYAKLDAMLQRSKTIHLEDKKPWVIYSDLHMGDGSSTDDFSQNSMLFISTLEKYYLQNGHTLLLNGDVEELQRFSFDRIFKKWRRVYELFEAFNEEKKFYKTIGNHDLELLVRENLPVSYKHHESLRLRHKKIDLYVYHGHQASKKYQKHNELIGFTLKYFANPLRIRSYSVSHDSCKQYKIEKRVYGYSASNKVVSIIGHTHRPLFESLDKTERLKAKIEHLCREYVSETATETKKIEKSIRSYRNELKKYSKNNHDRAKKSIYDSNMHIPCLFNSGCVVGKRGITCLEIDTDKIRLVHWFDKRISKKYLTNSGYVPEQLDNTDFYRVVINEESLDYIFARIKLLS